MSNEFKYFKREDFACKETGQNEIRDDFIHALDALREACGFPFIVTSGYRSPEHSKERNKPPNGGAHTKGYAADIKVNNGYERRMIVQKALEQGFSGIGVANTFVHVDLRPAQPIMWTY